jgi:hypothetical protein
MRNNIRPIILNGNDIIDIASDGGLLQQHSTFGVVISVNNTIVTKLNGSLPAQTHATSLTSEAYGCYYAIKKIWQQLDNHYNYSAINILLDNKTLISRLHKMSQYRPYPAACLQSEFEIVSAIADIIKQMPNINIKHITYKVTHYGGKNTTFP